MTQGPGGRAAPEPEAPTTFCALLPRMPQWKFAAPGSFLGRGPAAARVAGAAEAQPEPGVPALAAVLGACEPRCAAPCPLPALGRCRGSGSRGARGTPDVADEWVRKGGFIHKPAHGWLHPDARVLGPGVSYIVRVSAPSLLPGAPRSGTAPPPVWSLRPREPSELSTSPRNPVSSARASRPPPLASAGVWVPTASRGEGRGEGAGGEGTHACAGLPPPCCWVGRSIR